MAGEPPVGVWCLMRSKATRRELWAPPLSADRNHVEAAREGDGTRWLLEPDRLGYRIRAEEEYPLLLDSNHERQVYVLPPNNGSYQKWKLHADGEGFWQVVNVATGLALDGTPEDIYTMAPNDGAYQRWELIPA